MAVSGHNGNNETFIGMSSSSDLSLYYANMNEIPISRSKSPIGILIQRDNQQIQYPFQYVNTSIINAMENSTYLPNSFTIKSMNASIHIELKPLNTNISYLIVLKMGALPIINSSYADYSSFEIFCPSNKDF